MLKGVDVSHWQETINWNMFNLDFVMIKASGGDRGLYVDPMFHINQAGARAKKKLRVFYHYAGGLDPIKEADFFLATVGVIQPGEVLALDFEIHIANYQAFVNAFVQRIHDRCGFWPLFYSYSSMAALFTVGAVMNCGLWIADPSAKPRIGKWPVWAFWQYTTLHAGSVPGIMTTIDMNYFNGTAVQFVKYGKQ